MSLSAPKEGWKWLLNSKKWHYFRNGNSLCGKWATFGSEFEQGNNDSPDNCMACRRKLEAEKPSTTLEKGIV